MERPIKRQSLKPRSFYLGVHTLAMEDAHTKILASLIPDEIIYNADDSKIRVYDTAIMFGDVSGFTDLSERLTKSGKGGPSRLTEILNNYIGSMVQEILVSGGDILKFSGDAFIATWKVDTNHSINECVNEALDCSMVIQKTYGSYETDVQVILKVKIAIAAGEAYFCIIGEERLKHYAVAGKPVWDVKYAEYLCSSGDIVVSPSAWQYVNALEYLHAYMPDQRHVKVLGMGPGWKNLQKIRIQRDEVLDKLHMSTELFSIYGPNSSRSISNTASSVPGDVIENVILPAEFMLRPSVHEAVRNKMKDVIRPFIISPVMHGIEKDEPLEYLTETRQVVIMFINVITPELEVKRLLRLVDKTYRIVLRMVDDAEGCVNKISLFDKDLMLLVIFGLRGYKHDLKCQIALRCAAEIRPVLFELDGVLNASIGVTTGMTYCGVMGHVLRREYTVIGIAVNKAARLMVSYPGKVTCDKDVFLHSKLESCHFILQEPKELKGLTSIGPIYEFKEQTIVATLTNVVCKFPLLGRAQELKVFTQAISDMIKRKKDKSKKRYDIVTGIVIEAKPRQGKSRLLEEMIYSTGTSIPVQRLALTVNNLKSPFSVIQLIFSSVLALSELTSTKEREDKLMETLVQVKNPQMLCSLNHIFNVNFNSSSAYENLNRQERFVEVCKLIRYLFHVCFRQLWIIGIDDCHYMDVESWTLFPVLLEADIVLFILTLTNGQPLSRCAETALKHKNVKSVFLHGIERYRLTALACQILDVRAIPPDLEKVINTRSNGNPGWVESYLVSLIQVGGLIIRSVPRSEFATLGLISPPEGMMTRERRTDKVSHLPAYRRSEWNMSEFDKGFGKIENEVLVPVCTLAPNFKLDYPSTETTMDSIALKMFDALTAYEQLLLKCSSVIGIKISRLMLLDLMDNPVPYDVSVAIQRLFEVRFLCCAGGDLTENIFLLIQHDEANPNLDRGLHCDCHGVTVHETCAQLPKYASCGYMKFRVPVLRDTTYSLLTEQQKKELHEKCMKFLKRETRRCKSCKGGFFSRIVSYGLEEFADDIDMPHSDSESEVFPVRTNESSVSGLGMVLDTTLLTQINYEEMLLAKLRQTSVDTPILPQNYRVLHDHMRRKPNTNFRRQSAFLKIFRRSSTESENSDSSTTRSFSQVDFTNCQCSLILASMYTQLLEHCRGTRHQGKIVDTLLEYSQVCIASCNIPQAMKLLDDAQNVLSTEATDDETAIPLWKIPFILGKVYTLLGHARLELRQLEDAYIMLIKAMKEYRSEFPQNGLSVRLAIFSQIIKQYFVSNFFPHKMIGRSTGSYGSMADQLSECLSLLCNFYKRTQQWRRAKLAAIWSLNKALESYRDFYGLCTAFSNMLDVSRHYKNRKMSCQLENWALDLCQRKTTTVESYELQAVAYLYFSIIRARLMRSELEKAISLGYKTIRICTAIQASHLKLELLPPMISSVSILLRLSDTATLLNDLLYTSEEDVDKSGKVWFYSLCLDVHLSTGFSVVPFSQCQKFYQKEGESLITIRDPEAERRFFTNMWLWSIRNNDWETAEAWSSRARVDMQLKPDDDVQKILTACRLLEGLLLYMTAKGDNRTFHEVDGLMDKLDKATKLSILARPYFLILKAYYYQIRAYEKKSFKELQKAKEVATKQGDKLHEAWADHNLKAWKGITSPIILNSWVEQAKHEVCTSWQEIEMASKMPIMYSLPVPRFTVQL